MRKIAAGLALVVVTAVLAGALWWRASGGHWFVVQTPSMGQAAPVGTLLLTRPTAVADVRVGELVTFRSPSGQTYTHRVASKTDGGLQTRGDINGTVDPWTTTDRELVGTVVARWWGVGWLLRALPLVLVGLAVTWTLAAFFAPRRRSAVRQLGTTVTVTATTWWLQPWVGIQKLDSRALPGDDSGIAMRVVSTGIVPIQARDAGGGRTETMRSGEVAEVALHHKGGNGAYNLDTGLHLTAWWWVAVVVVCLAPLGWSLVTAPRPQPIPDET